jgi:ABC-type lipoprotein release transport system permease subunit
MDSKGDVFATIIGIVGDVRFHSLDTPPAPAYYITHAQRTDGLLNMTLLVRSSGNPDALAAPVRALIRSLDGDVAIDVETLRARVGESFTDRRFMLLVLGVFAASALLLAAVGIYGVVAFAVAQRTREIGIRMALGAAAPRVLWTIIRGTMLSVAAGITAGLAGATALARVAASFLYEIDPVDPRTFAAVALILIVVAVIAMLVPARRALRVTPLTALRGE